MRSLLVAIPVMVSVLALGGACSGSASDAPLDCNGPVDGAGAYCDPKTPCAQSYLDCYYVPGCENPHGTCERWAHCADTGLQEYFCSCDGKFVTNANQPIASPTDGATTSCGDAGGDASSDSGGATTDSGEGSTEGG